jgi:hypothetical protein
VLEVEVLTAVCVGVAAVVVVVGTAAVVDAVVLGGVLLDLDVVVEDLVEVVVLLRRQVPGARSVRLVGVGVLGTLVFGAVPTVMVALPAPR